MPPPKPSIVGVEWSLIEHLIHQHQELLDQTQRFLDLCAGQQGDASFPQFLGFYDQHILQHFKLEEQLMMQTQYPLILRHMNFHQALTQRGLEIKTRFDDQGVNPKLVAQLVQEMFHHTTHHMMTEDRDFENFLRIEFGA